VTGNDPLERKQLEHLSYSALSDLLSCGKKLELNRLVAGVPKRASMWLAGGLAVHQVTEEFDRAQATGSRFDPAAVWQRSFSEAIDRLKADDPDISGWRQKESMTEWMQLGPKLCIAYFQWRKDTGWQLWVTPDGELAVELDTSGMLPNCPIEIKQYVDRVFKLPTGELFLVDLKTGSRQPENSLQFGTYAAGIKARYGATVKEGAAFMNRKAKLSRVYDLRIFTPEYMGSVFAKADQQIKQGLLVASPGGHCFYCDVSDACYATGGSQAVKFDRDHPLNRPPF
jgi:hypothetical protein